jgi:hypothetical protein
MKHVTPLKSTTLILHLLCVLCFVGYSFRPFAQGCAVSTHFPTDTLSPSNNWQLLDSCSFAGEFSTFQVTEGTIYVFSTSQQDGSNIAYDSQLTLWHNGDTVLAYNDDLSNNELQSRIIWTADFSGFVELHLSEYDCSANTICGHVLYKMEGPVGTPQLTKQTIHVFPNPGNGMIDVTSDASWKQVRILNAQGAVLALFDHAEIDDKIDLSGFQRGHYLIEFTNEKGPILIPYVLI